MSGQPGAGGACRIIEEHWPLATDGTPLLSTESERTKPLLTDQEQESWDKARAEDKAW